MLKFYPCIAGLPPLCVGCSICATGRKEGKYYSYLIQAPPAFKAALMEKNYVMAFKAALIEKNYMTF